LPRASIGTFVPGFWQAGAAAEFGEPVLELAADDLTGPV
jgi:hypothetical protein